MTLDEDHNILNYSKYDNERVTLFRRLDHLKNGIHLLFLNNKNSVAFQPSAGFCRHEHTTPLLSVPHKIRSILDVHRS